MRAGNLIDDDGAALLAPSLGGMTQLTSLRLASTPRDFGGSWRCERVLASAGNALMMMRAVVRGGWARGCSGWWDVRGASRGAAARADNEMEDDGAASLAPSLGGMTQLTSLDLSSTLRASAGLVLFAGACERRLCMDDVCCGLGRLPAGCSRWWGLRGASRGAAVCADNWIGDYAAASVRSSVPATCAVYL